MSDNQYGFEWGCAKVTRLCSGREGRFMQVQTPRQRLDIHITPSGLIRTGLHKHDPKDNTFSTTRSRRSAP